nr:glutamate--tRNA ligase [bacterium]
MVRTRFAPSPTGYMHLGNLRTALYAYLFARANNGVFILRIEDTDQQREVPGAVEAIYKCLKTVGLQHDEGPDIGGPVGPYIQSQRRDMYKQYAWELVEKGGAYPCFCTSERLEQARQASEARGETFKYDGHCAHIPLEQARALIAAGEPYCIRQRIPQEGTTGFDDLLFGHIEVENTQLDDAILLKTDGLPTYNFANVVDDHLMGITHVLRGSEYLSSTPKYNLLYQSFGWEIPAYIHLPLIMADATRKLSKRKGDPSFEDLLTQGYIKEAIINYIALLGWNPGDEREFFTLEELCRAFSLDGLSKSPAIFDMQKLTWFNASYLHNLPVDAFIQAAGPFLAGTAFEKFDADKQQVLAQVLQPRCETLTQLPGLLETFLVPVEDFDLQLYVHKKMKTTLELSARALGIAHEVLGKIQDFAMQPIHDVLIAAAQVEGMKNGQLLYPLRTALTGRASTPGGAIELAYVLGREETLRRLEAQEKRLQKELAF